MLISKEHKDAIVKKNKKRLKKATKEVEELRKKVDKGELDLTKYEKIAEEF